MNKPGPVLFLCQSGLVYAVLIYPFKKKSKHCLTMPAQLNQMIIIRRFLEQEAFQEAYCPEFQTLP